MKRFGMFLCFLIFSTGCSVLGIYPARNYELYEPEITHTIVYEGILKENHFAYNHCVSIEHFDGKFYAVWQANYKNVEGFPGRKIYLSTSQNGKRWTEPVHFVGDGAINPVIPSVERSEMQSQPNLLNYKDRELWCSWCIRGFDGQAGTYVSVLKAGTEKWENRKVMDTHVIDGMKTYAYPSQNMALLKSGRVLMPVTFDTLKTIEGIRYPIMYNGFLYSDDDGHTWKASNAITLPDNITGQWEPCVHQQADGKVRMFSRNFCELSVNPDRWLLTCLGTGVEKWQRLRFDPDAHYSYVETANTRMHCIPISGGRWVLMHHDVYVENRGYASRYGGALFFSRTGEDDFVAGPTFTLEDTVTAYPQGVEHNGKLYVAYTRGDIYDPRSIIVAEVNPLPEAHQFYLWPRDKEVIELDYSRSKKRWVRTNEDYVYQRPYLKKFENKQVVVFGERGSAGIEIDPVDFNAGQKLELGMNVYIEKVQDIGNLILCSFGDQIPIRIGIPSARKDTLYAWGADQWQQVGPIKENEWNEIRIVFGKNQFEIRCNDQPQQSFGNPITAPNRRLFLGDGYEVDVFESNRGSVFYVDLDSIQTRVR